MKFSKDRKYCHIMDKWKNMILFSRTWRMNFSKSICRSRKDVSLNLQSFIRKIKSEQFFKPKLKISRESFQPKWYFIKKSNSKKNLKKVSKAFYRWKNSLNIFFIIFFPTIEVNFFYEFLKLMVGIQLEERVHKTVIKLNMNLFRSI